MIENEEIKSKTIKGLAWRFAERCGAQGVSFIVSIILARLIEPSEYGIIAMITIFIAISQVFVDSGMGNALIQKENADDLDYSSVFYFNIVICVIVYSILFLLAPTIAKFYNNEQLTSVIRVLGIVIIISAVKNVQQAYVSKNMLFKRFFFATIGGTIIAAIVGIWMAFRGYGVWALVAQQLVNTMIDTIILWITVKWRPKLEFSIKRIKSLFSFGWKLLMSSLINTFYDNMRQLVIGKIYSPSDLAYYNKGKQFPNLIVTNINTSIDSVLFPVLSKQQNNIEKIKSMTRRAIKVSSYIMWPLMIGLAIISDTLINLILTEKWDPAVIFLQIFCIAYALEPIQTANLNAIKALGRSDIFLKLEIIKKTIGIIILLCTMKFGVLPIAIGMLLYSIIASIINSYPNKKLLDYGYIYQIRDIIPSILLSLFMGAIIYPIKYIGLNKIITLITQIIIGGAIYISMSKILKFETFCYIFDMLRKKVKKM